MNSRNYTNSLEFSNLYSTKTIFSINNPTQISHIRKVYTCWKYVGQIFNLSFVLFFSGCTTPGKKRTEKNGPAVNKNNGRNSSRYFCGLERWVPAVPRHIWICHSWAANSGTATQFHYWQWNRFCHEWSSSITTQYVAKVQVFWAGHKNFMKLPNWFEFYLKSFHFKKTVARISFFSKLWYFQYKSKQKVPQFWKKQDSRNCLLKMNGLKQILWISRDLRQEIGRNWDEILVSSNDRRFSCS